MTYEEAVAVLGAGQVADICAETCPKPLSGEQLELLARIFLEVAADRAAA